MANRSIDEGQFITVSNLEQWLVIRGSDRSNPVLLILSGPGVGLSAIAPFFETWEESFTLVFWDQPGAGATYGKNPESQGVLSVERLASDGLMVVDHLRQRLGVEKVAVMGISAGSIIGLHMMTEMPGLFSAYVGTGQFVNWAEQDLRGYSLLLQQARAQDNAEGVAELEELGAPPYPSAAEDGIKSKYHSALTVAEMAAFPIFSALMTEALTGPSPTASYIPQGITLGDPRQLATVAYSVMRDEYLSFNAWALGLEFEMPVFFIQGDVDYYSTTSVVQEYEAAITAPAKATVIIEDGSHSVFWQREKFLTALRQFVLPVLTN